MKTQYTKGQDQGGKRRFPNYTTDFVDRLFNTEYMHSDSLPI